MSHKNIIAPTMREVPMPLPTIDSAASPQQPSGSDPAPIGAMGPLELAAYKADWRASTRYRRHVAEVAAAREHELLIKRFEKEALIAAKKAMHAAGKMPGRGFAEQRKTAAAAARKQEQSEQDEDVEQFSLVVRRRPPPPSHPTTAARVAARLMFARLFDSRPGLLEAIRSSAPIVAIDVPDPEMLERVLATWQDTLFTDTRRVLKVGTANIGKRDDYDAVHIAVKEQPKAKDRSEREKDALAALSLALPMIAISPASETHLPGAVLRAAPVRIALPRMDPVTIARVVRIVTGRPCRDLLDDATAARIAPVDMIVAIRFDRTPAECLAELRRLAADKAVRKGGRDINLDELHGMDDAVAWARSTIRDLEAWRRGEIPWSALDPGACLVGPPGTGKTLFAECFSRAAKLPMVACSLAQWQGSDEGHLGHLLRAMKRDFDSARAQAPCVMFVDEIDSFADRSKLRHAYADYVVEVVNGFIAQLDGVAGREGLIFLAASNDISRCDPAILRSGRLNRIIRIGLPNAEELDRMFRVRLAGQLNGEDLGEICLLALGSTGADVERITKDSLRFARHENRPLELADLRRALVDVEDRDPAVLRRIAIHETGHLLMELVLFGSEADVHATIARSGNRGGATLRTKPPTFAGTYSDYHAQLQVLLAGRTAEEIVCGEASHSAAGRRGSDLQRATALAAAMVASLGLAGPNRLLFLAPPEETDELLSYADVRATAYAELVKAAEACRSTLISHRAALDEIAATLLRAGRIDGVTAAAIIVAHRETKEGE